MKKMNEEVEFEFIAGHRKCSKLLYLCDEKQIYLFKVQWINKISNTVVKKYKCYINGCKATVNYFTHNNKCTRCKIPHSHIENQEKKKIELEFINNVKTEVAKPTLEKRRASDIFLNESVKIDYKEENLRATFRRMKRNLCRIKSTAMLKAPKTPQEFIQLFTNEHNMKELGMCRSNEKSAFYQTTVIETNFSYTLFFSPSIGNLILQKMDVLNRHYVIDATYLHAALPDCGYKQLMLIMVEHENNVFPFLYALMSQKSQEAYEHLFSFINANIITLQPNTLTVGHEKGLQNALHKTFPDALLKGSWFHFCQALQRHATRIQEFNEILQTDELAEKMMKKLMVLPLLPPADIITGFLICRNEAYENRKLSINNVNIFEPIFKYFKRQWNISETPEKLSLNGECIRTTKAVETYKSRFISELIKITTFWDFLNFLKRDEHHSFTELNQTLDEQFNVFIDGPSKKNRNCCQVIDDLIQNINSNHITVPIFLDVMSNEVKLLKEHEIHNNNDYEEIDFEYGQNDIKIEDNADHYNSVLCEICHVNEKNTILRPCKHGKICNFCFNDMVENHRQKGTWLLCPFCRTLVDSSDNFIL